MELAALCCMFTDMFPKHELSALGDQIRRSAVSILSNIAEGSKRHNSREYYHFCAVAQGSAAKLETQLLLARNIYSVDIPEGLILLNEVQRMLTGLCKQLKSRI